MGLPNDFIFERSRLACSQLRLLQYAKKEQSYDSVSLGAHTDYECYSLILQDKPGLQGCTRNGEWIDLELTSDAPIVVVIGDMLEVLTNGALKSCLHRVKPKAEERYSVVYFQGLDFNAIVKPQTSFGSPLSQYAPIKFGEHVGARAIENNKHLQDQIKCGNLQTSIRYGEGNPFRFLREKELSEKSSK